MKQFNKWLALPFALIITATSCVGPYTLKDVTHQKLSFFDSSQSFIIQKNRILLLAEVNGSKDTLLFDTGYTGTLATVSSSGTIGTQKVYTKKIATPEGTSEQQYTKSISDVSTNLWSFKNYIGVELFTKQFTCNELPHKILGYQSISQNKESDFFSIIFSTNTLHSNKTEPLLLNRYFEIKSSITDQKIIIYLNIQGTEHAFLLDTGFPEFLLMRSEDSTNRSNAVQYDGALFSTVFNPIISTHFIYTKQVVKLEASEQNVLMSIDVIKSQKIKENVAGFEFIRMFDWIIDKGRKRVFIKPIKMEYHATPSLSKEYAVSNVNNKLEITLKRSDSVHLLPLYKQIVSVNNNNITPENICYYKNYLNNLASWTDVVINFSEKP